MNKLIVKELIQDELTTENLIAELKDLLTNTARQQQLQQDYLLLWNTLEAGGNASEKVAYEVYTTALEYQNSYTN